MRTTVGLRFLYGYMNYDKRPINIDEQLALFQDRGLIIEDIATAKQQLYNISYFRIWSSTIQVLGKLDKVYNSASQLLRPSRSYMESPFCIEATTA